VRTDFPDADLVESLLVFNIRHNRYMEHRGLRRADLLPIFGSRSVATTKYINGHSDVVGGAVVVRDAALAEKIGFLQNAMGTCAGPQDCFLVLRGIKTLAVRMEEHNRNALEIARWLSRHPKVAAVLHPGLETHPQHGLALKQMRGYGGTFSFRLKGGQEAVFRMLENVRLFTVAESLGGVESLIEHPVTMTHASVPPEALERMGITPDLIRISVGIEDLDDLLADLDAALATPPPSPVVP
jgi:cystathionine gamma-lyase